MAYLRAFQRSFGRGGAAKKSCTSHHFTPYANWIMTKRVSTTCLGGSENFERGTVRKLHADLGVGQIWRAWDSRLRKNSISHLFWLVQTCLDLRTTQWPCTLVSQCHFLHFRTLLFFSLMSYPAEIAYFNSPNRQLSNGARVMVWK